MDRPRRAALLAALAVGASSTATSVDFTVSEADLTTGAVKPFTRVPTFGGEFAVFDLQLATGLVPRAEQVSGAPVTDRGRPPLLGVGAWLLAAGVAARVAHRLSRRRARRRAVAADVAGPPAADGAPAPEREAAGTGAR